MTNLSEQLNEKIEIDKRDEKLKEKLIKLNDLNKLISDDLKEDAKQFNKRFQDLDLREETRYSISNYCSNLFNKNVETSQKYRKLGNELYAENRYEEALNTYNQALFYAPLNKLTFEDEQNIDFALCLANRCAVFLQLKHYKNCLADIDLAIKYNYPNKKLKKLLERKEYCLEQLKNEAISSEQSNEKSINLTNSIIGEWKEKIIANENLKSGQIILEEESFCKTIIKLKYYERCFNCLKITENYIFPCRNCSQIKFCSEDCSDQAWLNGHYLECNKISLLDTFKGNYPFENIQLALKCILKVDLDKIFKELRNPSIDQNLELNENEKIYLNLLTKLKIENQFKEIDYESVAQIVTYLIDRHEIPKKLLKLSIDSSADYELFGAILNHQLNQLQSNTLSITQFDLKILELRNCPHSKIYQPFEEIEIGKGLFPIYHQLKHDLEPNCQILKFSNNKLILSALKEIKKGEELTINKQLDDNLVNKLKFDEYNKNKAKYEKLIYRYAFKCINCEDGAMLILNENDFIYLECLKCKINQKIEHPKDENSKDEQYDKVSELINCRDFCMKQAKKTKLLLYTKQPNLKTVEHNLLESLRELKRILFPTNLCLAEIEFDLSICFLQLRMYVRSIKHAMNAIDNYNSHYTNNQIQYLNGLIRLINIQYYFIQYTNQTNRELDDEHIKLYNYHLNNLKENLNFIINNRDKFFGNLKVQENLETEFNKHLNLVNEFKRM